MTTIKIDGHDIAIDYKAYVSKLDGIYALPVRSLRRTTWEGVHGSQIHREARRFDSRTITIDITFRAEGSDARTRAASLRSLLYPTGRPLRLEIYDDNGEIYGIYDVDTEQENLTDVIYEEMLSTQIIFVEAEPIKNIYTCTGSSAQFAINTTEALTISWGDGSYSEDIATDVHSHTYTDTVELHKIIISGNFDNVSIIPGSNITLLKSVRQ
jgi:hypothetical protein